MTEFKGKFLSFALLAVFLIIGMPFLPEYALTLATSILIDSIYVSSANLITGYCGLISLGQATFWGTSAYLVAILTTHNIVESFYLSTLIALSGVGVLSAFFGALAVKAKSLYFMILTFAFGHIIWCIVMYPMQSITHGFNGMVGIVRPDLGLPWSMENDLFFYYFVLLVAAVCFYFIYCLIKSPYGFVMVGIRDNEHRMVALGYNAYLYKFISYVLSAIIAGVGGILFVYFNRYVNPTELYWIWSGDALMMIFIGGIGSFWGPLLGTIVYTGLRYWVSSYTMYWFGIEGIIFILVVLFFRGGVVGFLGQLKRRMTRGGTVS